MFTHARIDMHISLKREWDLDSGTDRHLCEPDRRLYRNFLADIIPFRSPLSPSENNCCIKQNKSNQFLLCVNTCMILYYPSQ